MRFECPNCSTVYDVPDDKVVKTTKLKCSVCGNVWKITVPEQPEQDVSPEDEFSNAVDSFEDDAPDGYSRFVPPPPEQDPVNTDDLNAFFDFPLDEESNAVAYKKRNALLFGAAGVCLFVLAIVLSFFAPEKNLPVSFENVRYFFSEEDYRHFLNIEGAVVNKSSSPAAVGEFSVRFFNKSGINIANQNMPSVLPVLKPAEPVPFALKIERPPSTAKKIELVLKKVYPAQIRKTEEKTPETDTQQ